jgi:hypothetical protein
MSAKKSTKSAAKVRHKEGLDQGDKKTERAPREVNRTVDT